MTNQITTAVTIIDPKDFGLEEKKALEIKSGLTIYLEERKVLEKQFIQAMEMEITEENVKYFGDVRKLIKKNRTDGIMKWHKREKEFYLAGGRFVDAIKNKEIGINYDMEEKLEAAEKHFERLEEERKDKVRAARHEELSKYTENASMFPLADISEEAFADLLQGTKLQYEAKQEAIAEEQRQRVLAETKNRIFLERRTELTKYGRHTAGAIGLDTTEEEYNEIVLKSENNVKQYEAEQEAIRQEALALRKQQEEREALRIKRAGDLRPYIIFIRNYEETISLEEVEFKKALSELDRAAKEYQANEAAEAEKRHREAEEIRKKQDEVRKKQEAIDKELERQKLEKQARESAENLRREEEAKKAAELKAQGTKAQLLAWVTNMQIDKSPVGSQISSDITAKFNAFKAWAITEINKI